MKKLGIITLAIFCTSTAFAQIVLKYEEHAFRAQEHNPMSYCTFRDPGIGGKDMLWDFSDIRFEKSFIGYINSNEHADYCSFFPETNMELSEFSSRFYFRVSEDGMEEYGYTSDDGKIRANYTTPFVKIKFPFGYNDAFSGIVVGNMWNNGTMFGTITGSYQVEADAYGTLVLPGNTVYENTLRIRTEKEYTSQFKTGDQKSHIVTYRWYNASHRYPLLVLTSFTSTTNQSGITNYQAAYNTNALKPVEQLSNSDIELYPNPTAKELNISINALSEGSYQFDIFDSSGKLMKSFSKVSPAVGLHDFNLSDKISGLMPGAYILVINNGGTTVTKNFMLIE